MRAARNRTLTLTEGQIREYRRRLRRLDGPTEIGTILDSTICGDVFLVLDWLPDAFADLVFADPPYNITKGFNGRRFRAGSTSDYERWLDTWVPKLRRLMKPSASLYVCGDWRSSAAIHRVLERYFIVRNRITWEREKGRGALSNWKNCSEDIWFCTYSSDHVFNAEAVKLKRRVLAPYTRPDGSPKDWMDTDQGRFRLTFPSNLWTDITVPFWSMSENTDHPTQKPEKLLAKVILASSNAGDVVFDPFLGSGTTSVVAQKLQRRFVGVEIDETFCCLAEKRLRLARANRSIQGYTRGVFHERNALGHQDHASSRSLSSTAWAGSAHQFRFPANHNQVK
jgi:site-specific DNA-methyltransferase (adenine-specific)